MKKERKINLKNFQEVVDDQERLYLNLNFIRENKIKDLLKFEKKIYNLKIIQRILVIVIFLGIMTLLLLISLAVHQTMILINIIIIMIYSSYLVYFRQRYKRIFKYTKSKFKDYSFKSKRKELSQFQRILYLILIYSTIIVLIYSTIGVDSLIFFIIIGTSLIIVLFVEQ